jgi:hypothetical protein
MPRTQTTFVDLSRLLPKKKEASLIIRLMMACNDIALANQCLAQYKEDQPPIRKHVQKGALMYFVRLQCGHLKEAMDLIQKFCDDEYLFKRVDSCSQEAQASLKSLTDCFKGGPEYTKYRDYILKVRHKTIFHYDGKLVEKALADRASRMEAKISKITRGDHISLWRFNLSDDIVDSLICRQLWKIPREENLREKADEISDFGSNLCVSFLDFCGENIFSYIKEKATI